MNSLKDIARSLRISQSTVSRALSGAEGVSREMRAKIIELARSSGYSPDSAASSLRTRKAHGAVMIVPRTRSGIATMRDEALLVKARERFGSVRVMTLGDDEDFSSTIAQAAAVKPAAIISSGAGCVSQELAAMMLDRKIPLLAIDSPGSFSDRIDIDRATGTCQMVRLMLLEGSKNPLFICGHGTAPDNPDGRLQGIIKGYESLGAKLDPARCPQMEPMKNLSEAGYVAAEAALRSGYADAIFCFSDICAIGVMRALLKGGVRIPEDVKIVGFDDMPFAAYLPIALTTVAQPVDEAVSAVLSMIERRQSDFSAPVMAETLKSSLIIRESAPVSSHVVRKEVFKEL